MTWYDVTWHDMTWHAMSCYVMLWHDTTRHDMTSYRIVSYRIESSRIVSYRIVSYDMVWHGMAWHGMVYHCVVWYDTTWYYMLGCNITRRIMTWHDTMHCNMTHVLVVLWHLTNYSSAWDHASACADKHITHYSSPYFTIYANYACMYIHIHLGFDSCQATARCRTVHRSEACDDAMG